jgi:prepilin-type N-terminal cleavage/methylation domain-containing protein
MIRTSKGFTLVELLVVIMIIGVLATVAMYLTIRLQERAYTNTITSDLSSAYKASVAFHVSNAGESASEDDLKDYGYRPSYRVNLEVVDGSEDGLLIRASHPAVNGTYIVDSKGEISKE